MELARAFAARANKRGGARVTGVPAEVPRLVPVVRTHRCRDEKMRRLPVRPEPPPSPGGWREDSLLRLFSSGRTSLSHTHHALQLRVRIFGRTPADNGALPNDSRIQPDVVVGTRRSFSSSAENPSALGDVQRCRQGAETISPPSIGGDEWVSSQDEEVETKLRT